MPIFAVIDVGTNSVKFHVAERTLAGAWRTVQDRAEVTRLGEGLDQHGTISPVALARTAAVVVGMVREARRLGASDLAAVGTMGMRTARNGGDLVGAVQEQCGTVIEVIDGAEEGRLGFLAAQSGLPLGEGPVAVFDTGGGSTQFTFGAGGRIEARFSLNVGAVRLTEQYALGGPVSAQQIDRVLGSIALEFSRLDQASRPALLVGMGGGITNLAAVKLGLTRYDPDRVHGCLLERTEVERQIGLYRGLEATARRAIPGLDPRRADVILAGACVVRTVMARLGRDCLTVSDRGLRHGLLIDRFGR